MQRFGDRAAFLGAGGYHHHIGLNTWESRGGTPPPEGHTGLYHAAFLYPDRKSLGRVIARALDAGHALDGAADHGVGINAVPPSIAFHDFLRKTTPMELLEELASKEAFGRAAEVWEVANVMMFLASDYSGYMTGEVVSVSSQRA